MPTRVFLEAFGQAQQISCTAFLIFFAIISENFYFWFLGSTFTSKFSPPCLAPWEQTKTCTQAGRNSNTYARCSMPSARKWSNNRSLSRTPKIHSHSSAVDLKSNGRESKMFLCVRTMMGLGRLNCNEIWEPWINLGWASISCCRCCQEPTAYIVLLIRDIRSMCVGGWGRQAGLQPKCLDLPKLIEAEHRLLHLAHVPNMPNGQGQSPITCSCRGQAKWNKTCLPQRESWLLQTINLQRRIRHCLDSDSQSTAAFG